MRPRSIVGPLLLIALGTLFLVRNLWPEIAMFDFFARYWPFLLIVWGSARLMEVLFWHFTGRPLPAQGVNGGEWFVIVLLCVFGSLSFWGMNAYSRWPNSRVSVRGLELFGDRFEFPVSAEKKAEKASRVVLDLGRGNATIVGTDGDTIKVSGRKTVQAYNQADADRGDKETPLEIVPMGDQIVIRTNQEKIDRNRRASAELEISIPKGMNFEGRGRLGDFDVRELSGNVEINSDNAGVRLQNIGGQAKVDLRRSDIVRAVNVKGNVDIRGRGQDIELESIAGQVTVNGSYSGELSFRNVAKPLRFESPNSEVRVEQTMGLVKIALGSITAENVQGPVKVRSKVADVQVREFTQTAEVQLERGDIEVRPGAAHGRIDARTENGNIDLIVPAGGKFDLQATTKRGEINNDFGAPLKADTEGRAATLKGSTGGPAIVVETERGEITVRRAGQGETAAPRGVLPKRVPEAPGAPVAPPVPAPVQQ
ncbi:MAG: DUF4097 family beta strand repeat protein [Bryobacterales bacterium]|nr:DUF4097 family beta strand repeat protein [Bryobacterales bacterium]